MARARDLLDLRDMVRREVGPQFDQNVLTLDRKLHHVAQIDLAPVGGIIRRPGECRRNRSPKH